MQKILTLFITFLLTLASANAAINMLNDDEGILSKSVYKIDVIDPVVTNARGNVNYPGYRGADELVIYTRNYGIRTNTNEFGREAVVINDIVTKISGADSAIPANGYVISGHGHAKKWIQNNLNVGTRIFIDNTNMEIIAFTTIESYRFSARSKIREARSIIETGKKTNLTYDFRKSEFYMQRANTYLAKSERRTEKALDYALMASNMADEAIQHAIPYKNEELKGVWIRPVETSPEEIEKTLDKVAAMGVNNILIEGYYHGKTIFPSETLKKYGVRSQREEFVGWDPLEIWIKGAHARRIKIHIWFESFYAGNVPPNLDKQSILAIHPDWANYSKRNALSPVPMPHSTEHNGYFLDPANPQVQRFLFDLVHEISTKYKVDGINFDYVRYPSIVAANMPNYELSNWGYTKFARSEFKAVNGVDPMNIKYPSPMWDKWSKYRQDKITQYIKGVKSILGPKGITVSTVVFPDRQRSLETKMQDWSTWSKNGYVDALTPLILSCDDTVAHIMISDIKNGASPDTPIYAGLFVAYMDGNPVDLLRQIFLARNIGTKGIILFDYAHLTDKYIKPLKSGAFLP